MMDQKVSGAADTSRSATRAASVSLADFSAELSAGVLRAMDARSLFGSKGRPWIWAGWIIGDGPFGPSGPFDPGGPFGGNQLTPRDHTIIMRAIMEHILEVLRNVPGWSKASPPSPMQVLEAALRVKSIDASVKERISAVLDILPKLEEARSRAPTSVTEALRDLENRLLGKPLEAQLSTLRDGALRRRYSKVPGLIEGMDVAAHMLEDGRDTIYSPDFSFYELVTEDETQVVAMARGRDVLSDISSGDTIGATAGGAIGSVAGGVGAGPGAVAGGVGGSVGAAVGHFIGWLIWG